MSESSNVPKFTGGEWHHAGSVVRDEHDHDIAQMVADRRWEPGYGVPRDRSEIQANAALMAAAPDLLAACEALLWCERMEPEDWPAVEAARAAIKKARGSK